MKILFKSQNNKNSVEIQLAETEKVDDYSYKFLTNNFFQTLSKMNQRQIDDERTLIYNISSSKDLEEWLKDEHTEYDFTSVIKSISKTFIEIEDDGLYTECVLIDPKYIYVNEKKKSSEFLYIPLIDYKCPTSVNWLISEILNNVKFENKESPEYMSDLAAYVSSSDFNIRTFKDKIEKCCGKVSFEEESEKPAIPSAAKIERPKKPVGGGIELDFIIPVTNAAVQPKRVTSEEVERPVAKPVEKLSNNENKPGKKYNMPEKKPIAKNDDIVGPGGILIPGTSVSESPKKEKKKKNSTKGKKQNNKSEFIPENIEEVDVNSEKPKKKRLNLTELLIAYIKKLKEKKSNETTAEKKSKKSKKAKKDKEKSEDKIIVNPKEDYIKEDSEYDIPARKPKKKKESYGAEQERIRRAEFARKELALKQREEELARKEAESEERKRIENERIKKSEEDIVYREVESEERKKIENERLKALEEDLARREAESEERKKAENERLKALEEDLARREAEYEERKKSENERLKVIEEDLARREAESEERKRIEQEKIQEQEQEKAEQFKIDSQNKPSDRFENIESGKKKNRIDDIILGPNVDGFDLDCQDDGFEKTVLLSDSNYMAYLYPKLLRERTNEIVSISKAVFRIGKEKGNVDYCINNNSAISRLHAIIYCRVGHYYIVDTVSTNHTYINEKVIASNQNYEIVDGDVIRLADETFKFMV